MRPARKALRAASAAWRMASAMRTGCRAPAIPVFIRTAVQPSSMAIAASDAVPTPASTMTGTVMLSNAGAGADRRREGHDREAAGILEALAGDEIIRAVGENLKAFLDQALGG